MSVNYVTIETTSEGNRKIAQVVKTREEYISIRNSCTNQTQRILAREGSADAKRRLAQFNYSGHYPDGVVKGNKLPSRAFGFDIDSPDEFERIISLLINIREGSDTELTPLGEELGLLMLERSASQGGHAVFVRQQGRTILENQVHVAIALDCEMDTSTHDINRVYFSTTASAKDLLYLSDHLFADTYEAEAVAAEAQVLEERVRLGQEELPAGAHEANKHFKPSAAYASAVNAQSAVNASVANASAVDASAVKAKVTEHPTAPVVEAAQTKPLTYQGIGYDVIIAKYWQMYNGGKTPVDGNRNSLTYELAHVLAPICEFDAKRLEQVIPDYDGLPTDEWRNCIANALNQPRKGIGYRLRNVLDAVKKDRRLEATGGTATTPPPLPSRLPALIKLLTKNVPDYFKAAVAMSVIPPLSAHVHGVKMRYTDNSLREPGAMCVLIGRQAIGKSCVKEPISLIMADIKEQDKINRQREDEWKRLNPANKQKAKDPRPKDILIRYLSNNLTDAVFNLRLIQAHENGGFPLYLSADEVDSLRNLTSSRRIPDVTLLIRNAYDQAETGQERVGPDGITGLAPMRFSWNASTTPTNAKKFLQSAVNDGTMSRLSFCTIVREEGENSMPHIGEYDQKFKDTLAPYIANLNKANGILVCSQANKTMMRLKKKCDDYAAAMDSRAYSTLSNRSLESAWRAGMVLWMANGCVWTPEIAVFMEWMVMYDLWCKMCYFGDKLEEELAEEVKLQSQSGPQNMLELLGATFSQEEYQQMRVRLGKQGDGDSTIRTWKTRKLIEYDDLTGRYINHKWKG